MSRRNKYGPNERLVLSLVEGAAIAMVVFAIALIPVRWMLHTKTSRGIGLFVAIGIAGLSGKCWLSRSSRHYGKGGEGECEHCGYDLRGLTEPRCPECGTRFDPKSQEMDE